MEKSHKHVAAKGFDIRGGDEDDLRDESGHSFWLLESKNLEYHLGAS